MSEVCKSFEVPEGRFVVLHFDDFRIKKWKLVKEPRKKPDTLPAFPSLKAHCAPELPSNVSDLLPGFFVWLVSGVLRVNHTRALKDINHWGIKTRICEATPARMTRSKDRVRFDVQHVPGSHTTIYNRETSTKPVLSRFLQQTQNADGRSTALGRNATDLLFCSGVFFMEPSPMIDPSETVEIAPGQMAVLFADGRVALSLLVS